MSVDVNSGAVLTLDDGTTIIGGGTGTLTISPTGTLDIEYGSNGRGATLDGVIVIDNGAIEVDERLGRGPDAGRRHDMTSL